MLEIIRNADGTHTHGQLPPPLRAMKKAILIEVRQMTEPFAVQTMEGRMEGKAGDWLLTGVNGEMYPCDAAIFERTYDVHRSL